MDLSLGMILATRETRDPLILLKYSIWVLSLTISYKVRTSEKKKKFTFPNSKLRLFNDF